MKKLSRAIQFSNINLHRKSLMQDNFTSNKILPSNAPPNSTQNESYKQIMERFITLEKQAEDLSNQVQNLTKESSVHKELIRQTSQRMEKALMKEVLDVIKEQDYVTNGNMKEKIDKNSSAQEKLLDEIFFNLAEKLIKEFELVREKALSTKVDKYILIIFVIILTYLYIDKYIDHKDANFRRMDPEYNELNHSVRTLEKRLDELKNQHSRVLQRYSIKYPDDPPISWLGQ